MQANVKQYIIIISEISCMYYRKWMNNDRERVKVIDRREIESRYNGESKR